MKLYILIKVNIISSSNDGFRSLPYEFLKMVCTIVFSFVLILHYCKTIRTPSVYLKVHLLDMSKLVVFSLTEI